MLPDELLLRTQLTPPRVRRRVLPRPFREALPISAAGKILKRELRAELIASPP
jgi:hypothetical protein